MRDPICCAVKVVVFRFRDDTGGSLRAGLQVFEVMHT